MRVLVTIPHFCRAEGAREGPYRSEDGRVEERLRHVTRCLGTLVETFGPDQVLTDRPARRANERLAASTLDIILVTTGRHHLVEHLPRALFGHAATEIHPRLLGFFCHRLMAERLDGYDYFVYLEDDIAVADPLFFVKLAWFERSFGADVFLQPNRFEADAAQPTAKLYIDGPPAAPDIPARLQDVNDRRRLAAELMGHTFRFERMPNPHAGCFFASAAHLRRLVATPEFGRPSNAFFGPLESAATLPIMRCFAVYKPDRVNAGFLEVQHLGGRFLSRGA